MLLFGDAYNGSRRWLSIGPLSFQPAEYAKPAVILLLASAAVSYTHLDVYKRQSTRSNRERASQMNVRYVVFLTAAAVATVWMCVNYLQLKAQGTRLQKQVTAVSYTHLQMNVKEQVCDLPDG